MIVLELVLVFGCSREVVMVSWVRDELTIGDWFCVVGVPEV